MPFDFNYGVSDEYGNDYKHNAISDGDVTKGEYRILLPDGRTQVVKYTADWATGFHAQVNNNYQVSQLKVEDMRQRFDRPVQKRAEFPKLY